jgi:hypothetical protein
VGYDSANTFGQVSDRVPRPSAAFPIQAVVLMGVLSGCGSSGTAPAVVPVTAPDTTTLTSAREGEVAVRFLADPTAPQPKLVENEEFAPVSPRSMLSPTYPAEALRADAPTVVVAVRLMIDASGSVYAVKDSPRLPSSIGPFSAAYREAVDVAVRKWAFSGARIDTLGPPEEGSPSTSPRPLIDTRYVPTFLDFAFQFSVVEGRGVVSGSGPASPGPNRTPKE